MVGSVAEEDFGGGCVEELFGAVVEEFFGEVVEAGFGEVVELGFGEVVDLAFVRLAELGFVWALVWVGMLLVGALLGGLTPFDVGLLELPPPPLWVAFGAGAGAAAPISCSTSIFTSMSMIGAVAANAARNKTVAIENFILRWLGIGDQSLLNDEVEGMR